MEEGAVTSPPLPLRCYPDPFQPPVSSQRIQPSGNLVASQMKRGIPPLRKASRISERVRLSFPVAFSGAGTKRTPAGRDLWSRVGGFRRILSTPSAQDRFDFAGRKDLYTAYLPWAVAFDCADEWAKKYRVETGEEPPAPTWFPAYYGAHTGNYVSQMVDSFDSTVSSAISSYEATQSSSSGGGGGFSGGGGGGGGGGGSW